MSTIEYKRIAISNLLVNLENPRFESSITEKEALHIMIENQPNKLVKLAKDILEFNLNPADLVQVVLSTQYKNKYVVLEGNRRVSALKILKKPSNIDGKYNSFIKRLRPYIDQFKANPINSIYCVVYKDQKDSDKWIELKHTGENDGVGTVSWDSTQQARFNRKVKGNNPIALQAIEFMTRSVQTQESLKKDLHKLPYTNIERLLTDPDVREVIGITYRNRVLETRYPEDQIIKGLSKIANDFLYKDYTVNNVRNKKDRLRYLEEFKPENLPSKQTALDRSWSLLSTTMSEDVETETGVNPLEKIKIQVPVTRKTLIPKSFIIKIKDPRPNKIYHELKNLNVAEFENATAVTFRVFVELTIDAFIENKKGSIKGVKKMTPFREKVERTIEYFEAAKILNDHQLKGINVLITEPHGILSIDTFNAYVHNRTYSPKESHLQSSWDDIQLFVEKIWENIL